jgi:ribulose-phosphate 3-epimerase
MNRSATEPPVRLIAPSILSADFGRLGDEVSQVTAAGADWIHVDVMDGHFVPPITIGPLVVTAVRKATALPLDVHLMIDHPERQLEAFRKEGADRITVHVENCADVPGIVAQIRKLGTSPGLALNPRTPLDAVRPYLPLVDLLLVMTVQADGRSHDPCQRRHDL